MRVALIETFPNFLSAGIFREMQTSFPSKVYWLTSTAAAALDLEYFTNHAGNKVVTPIVDYYIRQNATETNPKALKPSQITALAGILVNRFSEKWGKYYDILTAEYNPIENYSMTETETPNISYTHGASADFSDKHEITRASDISRTESPSEDYKVTDLKKTETALTEATTSSSSVDTYGFNSSSPVHDSSGAGTSSRTTTGDGDENTETAEHTQTGTMTVRETGTGENNKTIDNHTKTGYEIDTETGTRNLTRSGNIGVTTSQQMIQSEIDLWKWNFVESVFRDIDAVLTLQVYEGAI